MDNPDENRHRSRSWLEKAIALLIREPQDREELRNVLRDAEDRDVLSEEMLGMMERILQVSEMQVREVMVPKAQMIVVNEKQQLIDLLPLVIESAHSRFPIVDHSGQDVIGMMLAKDILKYAFTPEAKTVTALDILRPAMFVPQSKRLDVLLKEFRNNRTHIAIVLDEYGHVAGLVTIEDVLEQIVGEIDDEYDIDEDDGHIKQVDDNTYIVKAATPIEEFNSYFRATFSDEEFDTIGGIVLHGFSHLPQRGETVTIDSFRFKVLHSDNRRIYLLEVKIANMAG